MDVLAVNLRHHTVRIIAADKSEADAEAIVDLAVMRRGVEKEFHIAVEHDTYAEGEVWVGQKL